MTSMVKGSSHILDTSWVSPKRAPKPPVPSATVSEVSRHSGLVKGTGTFGKADRFGMGTNSHSPNGRRYYHNARLQAGPGERGRSARAAGLGHDQRPPAESDATPTYVGPGTYDVSTVGTLLRCALDGPNSCNVTIKLKTGASSLASNSFTPSPGNIRKDLTHSWPGSKAKSALLSRGGRTYLYDTEMGTGFQNSDTAHLSVSKSASDPLLRGPSSPTSKYGTFGPISSNRFKTDKGVGSCSPTDVRYYDHSKIFSGEDYYTHARSCSFGSGGKTDFANKDVQHQWYEVNESTVGKSSQIDGFASRCHSPVKKAASAKQAIFLTSFSTGIKSGLPQASSSATESDQRPPLDTTK